MTRQLAIEMSKSTTESVVILGSRGAVSARNKLNLQALLTFRYDSATAICSATA